MRTRIIATIGPSSDHLKTIKNMIKNGASIARINTKYTSKKEFEKLFKLLKKSKMEILIDIKNVDFLKRIKNYDYEYLAISFASSGRQVDKIKKIQDNRKVKIISKIENKKGLKNFESILEKGDGIMIARGDLSENVPFEKIPRIQKEIIKKCKKKRKIVITATEMLLSMVNHKTPAKSEITDVANAVLDGSDMVMLSEETTIGKYPALAVKVMSKIIKESEKIR